MLERINHSSFLIINSIANKSTWLDQTVVIIAEYLPLAFIGIFIYLWLINKGDDRNNALYAIYSSVIGVSMNQIITLFYFHSRPFMDNIGSTLINHVPETSFPSDHTTFMLSIAVFLLFTRETRTMGISLTILGIIGGLSRVLCGIHYPLDIVGSLIVAIGSSLVVVTFRSKLININQRIIDLYSRILNGKA